MRPSTSEQQDICVQTNAFPSATLLERWKFHFEPSPPDGNMQRRRAQLARLDPPAVYKRAVSFVPQCNHFTTHATFDQYAGVLQVVMLRSLTSYVRLLPGYRMYRACKVLSYIAILLYVCCQHLSACMQTLIHACVATYIRPAFILQLSPCWQMHNKERNRV